MRLRAPSKISIIYFIMLVAIFRPAYVPISWINWVYRGLQAASLLYLLITTSFHKLKNSKLIILFGLYYFAIFLSTIIHNGNIEEVISEVLTLLLVILWIHNMSEKRPYICVNQLMVVFSLLIFANLVTILIFPNGLYRSIDAVVSARYGWLLGHQSLFSMYSAPAICVSVLFWNCHRTFKSAVYTLAVIISCILQTIILGSANNIICIVIILVGVSCLYILRMKKFNFTMVYIAVTALVLVVSVFQVTGFLEPVVTQYFHRSKSFTQRTFIWIKSIDQIKNHWLLGVGIQPDKVVYAQLGAAHAHNQYLQCLYIGGILTFIIFLFILFRSFQNLSKMTDSLAGMVMISSVVALMVQMIFEVYFHHTMGRVLIILSFYFEKLCSHSDQPIIAKRMRIRWKRLKG